MSNILKLCPTHFSKGAKIFLGGFASPAPPGYGPGRPLVIAMVIVLYYKSMTCRLSGVARLSTAWGRP